VSAALTIGANVPLTLFPDFGTLYIVDEKRKIKSRARAPPASVPPSHLDKHVTSVTFTRHERRPHAGSASGIPQAMGLADADLKKAHGGGRQSHR